MKIHRIQGFLALIVFLIFIAGCDRRDNLSPFGWSRTIPEFDSLTLKLERMYEQHADPDSMAVVVSGMRAIADRHPDKKILDSRTVYWEGRLMFTRQDFEGGETRMRQALALTDSADYPYDYNRILWNLDMDYHDPTLQYFEKLNRDLDYFISAGDYMISGAIAMQIGCLLNNSGDTAHGIPYLYKADSLFNLAGMPDQIANNRINLADGYMHQGDTLRSVKLLRAILRDKTHPVSDYARDIAVGNLYVCDDDTSALREAFNMVRDKPLLGEATMSYSTWLADEKMKLGQLDSARYYSNLAASHVDDVEDPRVMREYLRMRSTLSDKLNRQDSAYYFLKQLYILSDSVYQSDQESRIIGATLNKDIEMARLQLEIGRRDSILLSSGIIVLLLIASGVAVMVIYRRMQRQKLERIRAALELERSNRKVIAMEIVVHEKETLFDDLESQIESMENAGKISNSAYVQLRNVLKTHRGNKPQTDSFVESMEKIGSDFATRLRTRYPQLTDTDIRLASLVALGLDMKHIARVVGIQPESVKQGRWRLRSKMALSQGERLDDHLRQFLVNPDE